jgi:hypothetical protein
MTAGQLSAQVATILTLTVASAAAIELVDRAAGLMIIRTDPAATVIDVQATAPTLVQRDVGPAGPQGSISDEQAASLLSATSAVGSINVRLDGIDQRTSSLSNTGEYTDFAAIYHLNS